VARALLDKAAMRAFAVTAAAVVALLLGACDHAGRGHATTPGGGGSMGHFSERGERGGGGGGGHPSAPIATRVAREIPRAIITTANVATVAAAVVIQASDASEQSGDDSDTQEAYDRRLATTRSGPHTPPAADPCHDCPSDETCFYVDYVCPATTAQVAPIAPR
jgi:hypothetical protein